MVYGSVRKETEKAIFDTLQEHESLHYTELEKIVVCNMKVCSSRIFRETLLEMVQKNIVKKYESSRTNVIYSISSEIHVVTDEEIKDILNSFELLNEQNVEMRKVISSDASDLDKASEITKHLKALSFLEMQVLMLAHISGNSSLTKTANNLLRLKKDFLANLNKKSSHRFTLLGSLIYAKLFVEILSDDAEAVSDFVREFGKFRKTKKKKIIN